MDPYSSQNLQKYIQHEPCADDQLKQSRCLDVLFVIYTPRPLVDGIMIVTACDDDFVLNIFYSQLNE